jgi:hypothetical protein
MVVRMSNSSGYPHWACSGLSINKTRTRMHATVGNPVKFMYLDSSQARLSTSVYTTSVSSSVSNFEQYGHLDVHLLSFTQYCLYSGCCSTVPYNEGPSSFHSFLPLRGRMSWRISSLPRTRVVVPSLLNLIKQSVGSAKARTTKEIQRRVANGIGRYVASACIYYLISLTHSVHQKLTRKQKRFEVVLRPVHIRSGWCERSVGTVFQLPNPDAIYSRDEGKERRWLQSQVVCVCARSTRC